MEKELLFQAVEEGRRDEVFFTDASHGQMSVKVIIQDQQDHGEGIRQIGNDKIRQESMGLSAGALCALDAQPDHFRLTIREGNKVASIAPPFVAGSFCTAERTDDEKQRGLFQRLVV